MKKEIIINVPIVGSCQLQWEKIGIFKLRIRFLVLIMGLALSSQLLATVYVEDFEDDSNPSLPGFSSQIFQHTILPPSGGQPGDESWFFGDNDGRNPYYLALSPAIDEVVFSLGVDEYVDYASVRLLNAGSSAIFEAIGTLGTHTVTISDWYDPAEPGDAWPFADTSGANIGPITKIKLIADDGYFDNLTINVVPEPTTIFLFALGSLGLRRKFKTQKGHHLPKHG